MTTPIIENTLSTGLIIAGAYADKLRRTLFAQLRDYVKKNKEYAREIARAAGEINRLLYHIIVEELKSDKGDVVRIRVKYSFDPEKMEIKWHYDTLQIEYFKRYPDEKVAETVKKVLEEKLAAVKEEFREAPTAEEAEKMLRGEKPVEWREEATIGISEETRPLERRVEEKPVVEKPEEAKPVEKPVEIPSIAEADPIGATVDGGVIFKLVDEEGGSVGLATIEPHAGEYYIDAVLIAPGKAYRSRFKAKHDKEEYISNPKLLIDEITKAKKIELGKEEAESIIRAKMEALI